jgi:hypothetical protein
MSPIQGFIREFTVTDDGGLSATVTVDITVTQQKR